MHKILIFLFSFIAFATFISSNDLRDLNSITGKVYHVNLKEKHFEILLPTAYDPKSHEGKSRYRVFWNERTQFIKIISKANFAEMSKSGVVDFHYLDERAATAIKKGLAFQARNANVIENAKATGLRKDGKRFVAEFTPDLQDKKKLSGSVRFEGKTFKASIFHKKGQVHYLTDVSESELTNGIYKAKLYGQYHKSNFTLSKVLLYPLVDPRTLDDPNLPRVLVIGDSISMNYHDATKNFLKGLANYYRVEGNAGPSDRGVTNLQLWLGDYKKKGFHWDLIQFNFGLHDLKQVFNESTQKYGPHQVQITEYQNNLKVIVAELLKTGAKLIWCSTTPVPNSTRGIYGRHKNEDLVYNKAALEVISNYPEIQINDLNQSVRESSIFDSWREGDNVHFKDEEQVALGKAVSTSILKSLNQ